MGKKSLKKYKFKSIIVFTIFLVILFLVFSNFDKITSFTINFEPDTQKVEVKDIPDKTNILDAIIHSKNLLGVPEKNFRTRIKSGKVYISIGINPLEMDLNYANMILTGQVEMLSGKITIGKEIYNGNRQQLSIIDPSDSQKYIVSLYYAETDEINSKIQIAIVVDDFGIHDNNLIDAFCELDTNINFAILPHQKYSKSVMKKAEASGHETLIHIPMEPVSYPRNNPGANAIYVHLSPKEIRKRIQAYIDELPFCVGANNHMGSLATTDELVMENVLSVLKENGLYFIDSRTSQSSIAYKKAKEMFVPSYRSSLFLDTPEISDKVMKTKLKQIKYLAKNQDKILVITHCTTWERYEYLKNIVIKIKDLGYELIPVSEILKKDIPEIL